ncbi:hypothetical protein SAMN02745824_0672 [Parasphingorhabdus marina DSM 22363]|uniref:Beta-barrel porin 2 n=2 Tax=Parasphingorhabdus marina TaxID=394732 RepID=A0A1N6CPH2_9SPHN|nr:hypothetical protein SAMN02745824_0672 [Parasphingorhabdus marina DSM 22363]
MILSAPAFAETQFYTDVSLGAGWSSNPYLQNGPQESTISGSVTVIPRLVLTEDVTTFDLRGLARIEEFDEDLRTNTAYGLSASVAHSLSERTQLRAQAGFDGSIVGVNSGFFNPPDVINENFLPPVADDIGLNGTNQRRTSFQGGVGISHNISEVDSISLDVSATAVRFGDSVIQDEYNFFTQNVGYSRVLSETTSIGASVGLSQVNYLNQDQGDSNIISPSITFDQQIGPDFELSGAVGVSFARVDNGPLGKTNSTDFSGSFTLCRQGQTNNFCLSGSRQTLPSAFDGVRSQTSVGLGYTQKLSRKNDLSINAGYSRSSNPVLGPTQIATETLEYVRGSATFNHRFQDRITGFISVGYSDTYQRSISREANTQASIGIRVRFGNDQ